MFFIVKVSIRSRPGALTMKNIGKVANFAQQLALVRGSDRSSSPAPLPARKSSPTQRKTLAGCPFGLGARAIRAIGAKERGWLWEEER
ncbi:hypothetical protein [Paenibacillus eucommiae]|uniref:Uncharacterized protein n=1 Tax=Paenibacillus eucommiae TaxID=1355755 RepID=A0ABS4J112_9BACL|nr:hypothetical protein [Paenibacillus eucommiae]MBP1993501.1 hypothetical protein [Paenibacillus eucommiae]